jgi:hypothetical protein
MKIRAWHVISLLLFVAEVYNDFQTLKTIARKLKLM